MKWFLSVALLLSCSIALADIINLTSGETLEGEIIASDEKTVTLKVSYGKIIVEREFIKSIEKSGAGDTVKTPPDKGEKEEEVRKNRLRDRLKRWLNTRQKLLCAECGGDGNEKCKECNGTGEQIADPYAKTKRG